ncbi:MAG: hypothetical protein CMJ31_14535 [Phycisphaerae bacterium]|nr:hypothetical protein [Phycisphaerae bacterium]
MIPNASDLARRRQVIITVFRMIAVAPVLLMLFITAMIVGQSLQWGGMDKEAWIGVGVVNGLGLTAFSILFFFLPAIAGVFLPRRRTPSCPFCDYQLEGLAEPRCPECGNPLTPEFMGLPPAHDSPALEPLAVTIERRRSLFTSVIRLIGWLALLLAFPLFLWGLTATSMEFFNDFSRRSIIPWASFLIGFATPFLVLAIVLAFFGAKVARLVVPRIKRPPETTPRPIPTTAPPPEPTAEA